MKVIGAVSGISVVRGAAEEIGPPEGIVPSDLVALITEAYQCEQVPVPMLPPSLSPLGSPIVTFQNGKLAKIDAAIAIAQIQIRNDGIMVSAQSTNNSDEIVYDIVHLLNNSLRFRIEVDKIKIRHASSIVVEFGVNLDKFMIGIGRASDLINQAVGRENPNSRAMQIKRLNFGYEDVTSELGLDLIDRLDFLLERRAQHPFAENRYFSSAPISTDAHINVLQQLEAAAEL